MKDRRNVPAPLAPIETSRPNREDVPPNVDRSRAARIIRRRLDPVDLRPGLPQEASAPTNERRQNRIRGAASNGQAIDRG